MKNAPPLTQRITQHICRLYRCVYQYQRWLSDYQALLRFQNSPPRQYCLGRKTCQPLRVSRLNRSPLHLTGNSDGGLSNKSATIQQQQLKSPVCRGRKQATSWFLLEFLSLSSFSFWKYVIRVDYRTKHVDVLQLTWLLHPKWHLRFIRRSHTVTATITAGWWTHNITTKHPLFTLARRVPETPLPFSGFRDKRLERPSRQWGILARDGRRRRGGGGGRKEGA